MFDLTVHMGDIISVIGMITVLCVFLFRMEGKLNTISIQRTMESALHTTKFDAIERQLEKLADCMIQLAKQEEKINALSDKVESIIDIVRPKKARQSRSKT